MQQLFLGNIKDFESLELRNLEANKPETKTRNPRNLFYFRVREAPSPINIPTPTPAPDHLLGRHITLFSDFCSELLRCSWDLF